MNPTDLFLLEYVLSFLSAVAGKTRQLDSLYLVRQSNAPGSTGLTHLEAHGDWLGRMLVPSWSDDFTAFVTLVATALAERDAMSLDEARRWVIDTYKALVAPAILEDVLKVPTARTPRTLAAAASRKLFGRRWLVRPSARETR